MAGGTKPTIGFIDLGLMRSAMLQRLQSIDYAVTVFAFSRKIKSLQWR
jgi:3-hydroxyisobutyrate dehydrogenase-like beta-hydroxyacid dehydrogenase